MKHKLKTCPHDGHECEVAELEDRIEELETEVELLRAPLAQHHLYVEAIVSESVQLGSMVRFVKDPTDPLGIKSVAILVNDTDCQGIQGMIVSLPSGDDPYCGIVVTQQQQQQ